MKVVCFRCFELQNILTFGNLLLSRSPEGSKEGSPEGSKEAGVMNEQQTSSNQSDKCTKDEANSQPFVDQSQVSTDDPTDKSNTRQEETKNENTEKQSQPPQL